MTVLTAVIAVVASVASVTVAGRAMGVARP
jgi:hypothetical protein